MANFKQSKDFYRAWGRRPAWTPLELARISCGWDPADGARPNTDLYNRVIAEIRLSVNTKDPRLPVVTPRRWRLTKEERFYDVAPLLKPAPAWQWANKRWPETILPFTPDHFTEPSDGVPDKLRPLVSVLVEVWQQASESTSNKELAVVLEKKLGITYRAAEEIIALIRPLRKSRRMRAS